VGVSKYLANQWLALNSPPLCVPPDTTAILWNVKTTSKGFSGLPIPCRWRTGVWERWGLATLMWTRGNLWPRCLWHLSKPFCRIVHVRITLFNKAFRKWQPSTQLMLQLQALCRRRRPKPFVGNESRQSWRQVSIPATAAAMAQS